MLSTATPTSFVPQLNQLVGLGQLVLADAPHRLWAILGSCVGVAIYHPRKRVGVLAHIVLPNSGEQAGLPGRYADSAIPAALRLLEASGANAGGLVAKIAGGAAMFETRGPLQAGQANIAAVRAALETAHIKLLAEHVGETRGRKVIFDLATGILRVEIVGQPILEL
ncbi:MAG: chemotaxis protein CheD [Pirellulales bacterium]|nr:chemotaxis protein CheD [Pirellulales bacterium]